MDVKALVKRLPWRMSFAARRRLSSPDSARVDALAAQMTHILTHVAATRKLALELERCKERLARLEAAAAAGSKDADQ